LTRGLNGVSQALETREALSISELFPCVKWKLLVLRVPLIYPRRLDWEQHAGNRTWLLRRFRVFLLDNKVLPIPDPTPPPIHQLVQDAIR